MTFDRVCSYSKHCPPPALWGMMFITYGISPVIVIIFLLKLGVHPDRQVLAGVAPCLIGLILVGVWLLRLDKEWVKHHWPSPVYFDTAAIETIKANMSVAKMSEPRELPRVNPRYGERKRITLFTKQK